MTAPLTDNVCVWGSLPLQLSFLLSFYCSQVSLMTRRDLQKRQTRHAYFQAVLDLSFAGQAFSSISLRQVSKQVGVVPTAFYRHFSDLDALGIALVNEVLGQALDTLRRHLHLGEVRTQKGQIAHAVGLFFESIATAPLYWHFVVSERYGGNPAVQTALDGQLRLFVSVLAEDLAMQPAFSHLSPAVLRLTADMGVNVFFSWVHGWLKMRAANEAEKHAYISQCVQQAQILFYGIGNFRPSAES